MHVSYDVKIGKFESLLQYRVNQVVMYLGWVGNFAEAAGQLCKMVEHTNHSHPKPGLNCLQPTESPCNVRLSKVA